MKPVKSRAYYNEIAKLKKLQEAIKKNPDIFPIDKEKKESVQLNIFRNTKIK
jgi:hypothetical protein